MSDDSDRVKVVRRQRKAAITRHLGTLDRLVAEEDIGGVQDRLDKLRQAFMNFEESHDDYLNLIKEDELPPLEADFIDTEQSYINGVKAARSWIKSITTKTEVSTSEVRKPVNDSSELKDLINALSIPKVDLETFDGNPLKYPAFMVIFDEMVDKKTNDNQVKLTRLLQYTTGEAKAAIRNCALLGGDAGYAQAKQILGDRFGNPYLVSQCIIDDLKNSKPVSKPHELQQLADDLSNAVVALSQLGLFSEINTQQSILDILRRCQPYVRNKWRDRVFQIKANTGTYPSFVNFVEFIKTLALQASDPVYGSAASKSAQYSKSTSHLVMSPQTSDGFSAVNKETKCVVCSLNHRLFYCDSFKALTPKARLEVVKNNKLCFNCLLAGHASHECRKESRCTVPGCGRKHTKFIHIDDRSTTQRVDSRDSPVDVNTVANHVDNSVVYLPMVPVVINGRRKTYALLDSGSTNTFIAQSLVNELGLHGKRRQYTMNTLTSRNTVTSEVVSMKLNSLDADCPLKINNVLVVPEIPVRYPSNAIDLNSYPHLRNLPIHQIGKDAPVELLLGMDNSRALMPIEVRYSSENRSHPYATLTLFGWSLNGAIHGCNNEVVSNFMKSDVTPVNGWNLEQFDNESVAFSIEDKKVLDLWDSTVSIVNGHYVIPIPWRDGRPNIPNNRSQALVRLKVLLRRLQAKGSLGTYADNIDKLQNKGYAERVPAQNAEAELTQSVWYLPHHGVTTVAKPKLRVVFDCAAQYNGVSLNSQCFQGPDLTNKLVDVLNRFRQYEFAVMADVEAMYLQVKIPEYDRDALRFLWSIDGQIVEYRMTSHLFGGVWCASSSTYALRKTVDDFPVSDLVKSTVLRGFYVDDMLQSAKSLHQAREIIQGTKQVLSLGGFNLTKFIVNDHSLLNEIDADDRAKEVKEIATDVNCKALGIRWDVFKDELFYVNKFSHVSGEVTRRQMLSQLNSFYDPIGLISPILVAGKMLFQNTSRLNLVWDVLVPKPHALRWCNWITSLESIHDLKFPRCLVPRAFVDGVAELHHFCDASQHCYGACSYLRIVNRSGQVHTALLASKARLAPIKEITIPRLELSSAVLAACLDSNIKKQLEIPLLRSTFWTDSMICLAYIKNQSKRFKVFVANRVSKIREFSDPEEWFHINGADNPADVLSRGCSPENVPLSWYRGPSFLSQFKSEWPVSELRVSEIFLEDNEVRKVNPCFTTTYQGNRKQHPFETLIAHFSSFYKLKKAVCWILRVKDFLMGCKPSRPNQITVCEMNMAENLLIMYVQKLEYGKALAALKSGKSVPSSSNICKLSPTLENDILVVGGRLTHSSVSDRAKHPIILPHSHHLSEIIVRDIHTVAHFGTEWTLSMLREKFWVTKARPLIKKVKHECVTCKKLYGAPVSQKMADLPPERTESGKPPFSYVGVDLFGPFYVKLGRSLVKRYGCVFTCFTCRAIHLEVLHGLDTSTFINGFMRFVSRRGCPIKIWSDNGTILWARTKN